MRQNQLNAQPLAAAVFLFRAAFGPIETSTGPKWSAENVAVVGGWSVQNVAVISGSPVQNVAYNTLSFYSGINGTGSLLLSLTGKIDFGNQFFESVVLTTASNAFEYTNLQVSDVTAVPIPPALPLFATGLGALGLPGWRRKVKPQAA